MSVIAPKILDAQNLVHLHLETAYKEFRLERDKSQETILWLASAADLPALAARLRSDPALMFCSLSDITAYDNVDQYDGAKRFVSVVQLYSMSFHVRLRLKVLVAENESVPTLTRLWKAANWLEREVYDLFGIRFEGHPDLRRILMDERFMGHPLRKEYDLKDRQPFDNSLPVRIAERAPGLDRPEDSKA